MLTKDKESFIPTRILVMRSHVYSKSKKLRLSANSIENVFFIHKYLRLQAYPVTTIKASVLAIPNQQRTAIRKRSQVPVCVYIKERFPISSRSPQCVLNDMKKIPPPNFVFLTMKLSMNHRAIQSLNTNKLSPLYTFPVYS